MSHYRWTIKELKHISNKEMVKRIINEREFDCTNPHSPLSKRLHELWLWANTLPDEKKQ